MGGKTGFWSNFNLMMYKVWLEKIRRPISFLVEIVCNILCGFLSDPSHCVIGNHSVDLFAANVGLYSRQGVSSILVSSSIDIPQTHKLHRKWETLHIR